MKFKLDENLSPELSPLFSQAGHEAHTVLEERLSGAEDDRLFVRCIEEGRVLVTLDLDFSNLDGFVCASRRARTYQKMNVFETLA